MAVVLPWTSWGGDYTWGSPDKGPSGTDGDLGRVPAVMRGYLWTHPSCRTGEKRQRWRCPHITTPATCNLKYTDYEEKNCMLTVSRKSNGVAVESLNSNFCITISSMRWMSRPLHAHSYWWTRTLKSDSTAYVYAWVYGQQDMNSVKTTEYQIHHQFRYWTAASLVTLLYSSNTRQVYWSCIHSQEKFV